VELSIVYIAHKMDWTTSQCITVTLPPHRAERLCLSDAFPYSLGGCASTGGVVSRDSKGVMVRQSLTTLCGGRAAAAGLILLAEGCGPRGTANVARDSFLPIHLRTLGPVRFLYRLAHPSFADVGFASPF